MTDGSFAIKKLKCDIGERSDAEEEFSARQGFDKKRLSDAREEFEAEVEILRRFSGDTHPHLVSLLAAFQQAEVSVGPNCVTFQSRQRHKEPPRSPSR